uniref:Ig-like domain-containing protein n=1 Tax=Poecilia reticulata TaxID=8081 RepID=A0A3P9QE30_POERE
MNLTSINLFYLPVFSTIRFWMFILDVSVQEGETAKITCCWNGSADRVRFRWLKIQTLIESKTVIDQSTGFQNEQKNRCSLLTIETTTRDDSGKYICKVTVEIPVLMEVEGNGTTITVTARKNPSDSADHQPDSLWPLTLAYRAEALLYFKQSKVKHLNSFFVPHDTFLF